MGTQTDNINGILPLLPIAIDRSPRKYITIPDKTP